MRGPGRCDETLLAVAAHEIRAPLTVLTLQLELAGRLLSAAGPPGAAQEQLATLMSGCHQQARRISDLVATLLDVTLLGAGQVRLRPEEVDLPSVVRDALRRLDPTLRAAGAQIELRCAGPLRGRWDPGRLDQIVTNLVENAVKYGGGRPIEILVGPQGDRAALTVRDHGDGLDAEEQRRIFECYGRAARHSDQPGLGLGLYIVRTILQAMGGTIAVQSEPGAGAAFRVELPLAATP